MATACSNMMAPLELEVADLDEFLRLLELAVKEPTNAREGLPRRAVCVAAMYHRQTTEIGVVRVKRYVWAGFASGDDLVTFQPVSSDGFEHPDPEEVRKLEEKHRRLCEHLRGVVQDSLVELGPASGLLVVSGCLRVAPVRT